MVHQSIAEFIVLALTGSLMLAVTAGLLTNYRGFLTKYARHVWTWYQRPRRRWLHPTTEEQDRFGIRLASGLGVVLGGVILIVEVVALMSGHVK